MFGRHLYVCRDTKADQFLGCRRGSQDSQDVQVQTPLAICIYAQSEGLVLRVVTFMESSHSLEECWSRLQDVIKAQKRFETEFSTQIKGLIAVHSQFTEDHETSVKELSAILQQRISSSNAGPNVAEGASAPSMSRGACPQQYAEGASDSNDACPRVAAAENGPSIKGLLEIAASCVRKATNC